jgi:hypothetical protein
VQPEALGERAHLLSQVVERTAEDRPLLAQHRGLALELGGDRLERVGTLGQEIDPLRGDHRGDDLVHHAVAELGLAREVVEERALGRASEGEDPLERRRLEAVQVDLLVANRPVGTLCASGEIKAKARRDRAVPAKKRTSIPEDKLRRYEQLIGTLPGVESRANFGAGYTAVNGNMYTTLSKHGTLGIRLPEPERTNFMERYDTELFRGDPSWPPAKEYVAVPDHLLDDTAALAPYLARSYEYASSLRPKATKRKRTPE